jgi:peptidoglycan hydrolase-like protein with peptidoglycan-binding domain
MASATLAQTFRLGDSGPEITVIQERLQKLGYLNQSPTGNFGSVTRDAVIQFQQEKGLPPDGIVGPETIAELFSPVRQARFETFKLPPIGTDVARQTFSPTTVQMYCKEAIAVQK